MGSDGGQAVMASAVMTTGIYNYRNSDGTTVPIDVATLPVTNKPCNIIIPNVWIAGDDDPEPTGQLFQVVTPLLWVDAATNEIYRTTTQPTQEFMAGGA